MEQQTFSRSELLLTAETRTHLILPDNYKVTCNNLCVKALYRPRSSLSLPHIYTVWIKCAVMYILTNTTPQEANSVESVLCDGECC